LDYFTSGGTAGCPALLVEPSAQNLVLQSENFSTTWTLTSATISGNTTIAPDGTLTADTLTATAVNGQVQQVITGVSGTTYTASFYIKRRTGTGVVNIRAVENVDTPVTVTNNWTRVSFSATATTTTVRIGIRLATSGDEVDLWGAQLETGSIATSYIPTTAAAVTRNADVVNLSGAVSGCIGQTEGTIYAEVDLRNTSSGKRLFLLSDGTSQNEIRVTSSATNAGDLQFAVRLAGTLIINAFSPTNVYSNGIFKIAAVYKSTDYALYVNGLQVLTSNSAGNIPACNRVDIGSQLGTSNFLNDRIRSLAIYTTRLTNSELAALTTL
jgi:hypothetical protein